MRSRVKALHGVLVLATVVGLVSGCDASLFLGGGGRYDITVFPFGEDVNGGVNTFQIGDTVQFVGSEYYGQDEYSAGSPAPKSTQAPEAYQWVVGTPTQLEDLGAGRFRMVALGDATFQVSTKHTTVTFRMLVVPRISGIAFDSTALSAKAPGQIEVAVHLLDAGGQPLVALDTAWTKPVFVRFEGDNDRANPIALVQGPGPYATAWFTPFRLTLMRAGTIRLVAYSPVYRAKAFRDTVMLTVK